MVKHIQMNGFGGPEVMSLTETAAQPVGADEIRVRNTAIGVNYIDTYHRSGLYPIALPSGIGMEGAGIVEEVGGNVADLKAGDRVAYCSGPIGSYAESHVIKADRAVIIPAGVSDDTAAAMMLKGLTVQYLIRQIYKVKAGDTVLFHAAAGGVGLIACQWLKHLGATTIGTVSTEAKADLARAAGCDHIIFYNKEDVAKRVVEITDGAKVPVVFDGVGASTWEGSLDSLQKRGLMICFGNASGPVKDVNLGILAAKGSLFVTRPTLFDYIATKPALDAAAAELFDVVGSGAVKINITGEYRLEQASEAHKALEGRKTTGSIILRP